MLEKDILLGDEIYGTDVPEEMEGKLFHYQVQGCDNRTKKFTAQYNYLAYIALNLDVALFLSLLRP